MQELKYKKLSMTLAGILVPVLNNYLPESLELSLEALTSIITLIVGYLVSQGIADHGKEKERIHWKETRRYQHPVSQEDQDR